MICFCFASQRSNMSSWWTEENKQKQGLYSFLSKEQVDPSQAYNYTYAKYAMLYLEEKPVQGISSVSHILVPPGQLAPACCVWLIINGRMCPSSPAHKHMHWVTWEAGGALFGESCYLWGEKLKWELF